MNRTKKNDLGRKYAESETKKEGFPFRHWKVIAFYLVLYDIVAVNFSYFFGLLIRFDLRYSSIPKEYLNAFIKFAPFYTAFVIIIFYVFRLYNSLWRFASFSELNRVFFATIITTVFQVIGITKNAIILLYCWMWNTVCFNINSSVCVPIYYFGTYKNGTFTRC